MEIKYEIVKSIGVLSISPKDWRKELNLVSWNDKRQSTISVNG